MSYDALRSSLLEARDRRQEMLRRQFPSAFPALLFLSLNLPGDRKTGPRADRLFQWGERSLFAALPVTPIETGRDALGPFAIYALPIAARQAKLAAIEVELAHPAGRLLDLDLYDSTGLPVDRASLGIPPRACLLCQEAALACIRAQRHDSASLQARAEAVIDAL